MSAKQTASSPAHHADHVDRFAGREAELERLADAYERTCDDGLTVVVVEGESGLGKSALVAEFGRRIQASVPNAIVLGSRCYESEQVAFKAFDGAVDQLAQALRALPSPTCEALLPRRAALLGLLFPCSTAWPSSRKHQKRGYLPTPVRDTVPPSPASSSCSLR